MNDLPPSPDNGEQKTKDHFLLDGWCLSDEKSPTESAALFDRKIIARMPDLGSESIIKSIEKPKFPLFWGRMYSSVLLIIQKNIADTKIRQRFFHYVTTIGGVVLLCGLGILLLIPRETGQTKNAPTRTGTLAENTDFLEKSMVPFAESAFSPILPQESGGLVSGVGSNTVIPVAPIENIVAVSPPSPWDRPVADSHSPWEKQSENAFQPVNTANITNAVPVAATPAVPSGTVAMSPMTPMSTAPFQVSPYEVPVSPYGTQRVAQSNMPSSTAHVGDSVPPQYPAGMQGMTPQQPTHWQTSAPHQSPSNAHGYATTSHHSRNQISPHTQYVVPPGYMLPSSQVAQQNLPIPSGVSTLPAQGGQPIQTHSMPVQNIQPQGTPPPSVPAYYYNTPPTHRRVY